MKVELKKNIKPFMIRHGNDIYKINSGSDIPEEVYKLHKNKLKEVKDEPTE